MIVVHLADTALADTVIGVRPDGAPIMTMTAVAMVVLPHALALRLMIIHLLVGVALMTLTAATILLLIRMSMVMADLLMTALLQETIPQGTPVMLIMIAVAVTGNFSCLETSAFSPTYIDRLPSKGR
jgi:hypothetical protein